MKKANPFASFEKSPRDKEKKGMKEGSKPEKKADKKQMGKGKKMPFKY